MASAKPRWTDTPRQPSVAEAACAQPGDTLIGECGPERSGGVVHGEHERPVRPA